jgi:Ran GTPase-activating protein (RanGAP) involved in mRNA processing and transport
MPLQSLHLSSNDIDADGAAMLEPHCTAFASLQSLELGDNGIIDDGAVALSSHLAVLTLLHNLHLGDNSIAGDSSASLALTLKRSHRYSLYLYYNNIARWHCRAWTPLCEAPVTAEAGPAVQWHRS